MVPVEPHQNFAPGDIQNQIYSYVPEIKQIADLDIIIPFNMDSSNIGIREWDELGALIYEKLDEYSGFVVIHGTDTMIYTASALSFTLRNLPKPVILTGAQRPLSKLRSDARSNLIDSVELATMDIPEVLIVFGQYILRGNRTIKISVNRYDAFNSPNYPPLGEIGVKINLDKSLLLKPDKKLIYQPGFMPTVAMFPVYPTMSVRVLDCAVNSDVKVIILLAFGAGNLPGKNPDWIPFIEKAVSRGKSVFIGSQSVHGGTDLELYECGRNALQAGAYQLGNMTSAAAYVKLHKILKTTEKRDEIYDRFHENWAGEI